MSRDVVISNSRLNNYRFRILTSGIDVTQFNRNPILLWMHNRPSGYKTDEVLPIGRVENLRIEGDNLIGTLAFDPNDEFAKRIEAKWDGGFLRMVSAGIEIIELSDDPAHLLPGQSRMTVVKSKLQEVSVVDIGANDDALSLSYQGRHIQLSNKETNDLDFLSQKNNRMKSIALLLGLAESSSAQHIESAIGQLKNENEALRQQVAAQSKQAIEAAVDSAIKLRQITEGKRAHFVALGEKVGVESLQTTLSLLTPAQRPSDITVASAGDAEYKKLSEVPTEELIRLRQDNPAEYAKLYRAEYGVECTTV